jgi:all-trans-retinol dehydrogenase (NAD+)
VLTGGATGLGREQAFALAKSGVGKLILWDINLEQLEATAQDVKKEYPNAQVFAYGINLVNREAIYTLAKKVIADHGFVWGLINNAGVISGSPILETPDKKIELTMGVNVMAHFWTIKAFLPDMITNKDGHIAAISSAAGFFPSARMSDYCASKYAARGLMEALRIEIQSMGLSSHIKTTIVAPANFKSDLFAGYSLGPAMEPRYVANQVVTAIQNNDAVVFVPHLPLYMGNVWQGILPTWVYDIFMRATDSQLSSWKPDHANKIFSKMEKSS